MMHVSPENFDGTAGTAAKLPRRPDASVLNEAIPLFFIGRNKNGLWLAREAGGQAGGIFLFRDSALRFAGQHSLPGGCATMFLSESFELDFKNRGNPLVAWLDAALGIAARLIPAYPPAIPIGRKYFKDWQ
jgi:hypothetical protein